MQLVACYEVQACDKIPSVYKRDLHAVGDLLSSGLLLVVLKNGPHAPGLSRAILDARSMLTVVDFQGSVAASADAVSGMIVLPDRVAHSSYLPWGAAQRKRNGANFVSYLHRTLASIQSCDDLPA